MKEALDGVYAVSECTECAARADRARRSKKHTCPECKFSGWYDCDADNICPSCVIAILAAKVEAERVAQCTALFTVTVPKEVKIIRPYLELYADIEADGCASSATICKITLQGAVEEDILIGEWPSVTWRSDEFANLRTALAAFLEGLATKYIIRWRVESFAAKMWLIYLCKGVNSPSL